MIQYAFKKKCSERIAYSEPILEKVSIGQKPRFWQRKSPENRWFSGLDGGDKRDRTADLLNAMGNCSQIVLFLLFVLPVQPVYYHKKLIICRSGPSIPSCFVSNSCRKCFAKCKVFRGVSHILNERKMTNGLHICERGGL